MWPFKKYVACIMAFFTPSTLTHFVSFTLPLPLCHSVNFTKKLWNEREKQFLHIWLLQHIMLYQRRQKITSLNTIEFLDTYAFINNPHQQSSGILIFLCKYYIVISDTLVGSFLDMLFLLLAVILSELHEKPRRKD